MRIIHITFSLNNAGKENMLVDIANEQQSLGHEVSILVMNDSLEQSIVNRVNNNICLYELHRKKGSKNPLHIFRLIYILNIRFRADVIHSHDPHLGLLLKYTSFIPAILTIHGPAFNTSQMRYYKKLIAVSKAVKTDVESRSNNKCEIIYNGIRIHSIKQHEPADVKKDFYILLVGRLDHLVKGQDLLIDAASWLVNRRSFKNVKFFMVGEGNSRKLLEESILNQNLGESVFLLGNKDREWIYGNLHYYDLFIQPSRLEGFGLTVVEAMAARVPVIASDIEGPAEILENGKYGILFENNNHKDLADKIESVIQLYQNHGIESLTDMAYQHCLSNFNITRTAQNYCNSYSSVLNIRS